MAIENLLESISKLLNTLEIPYMLTGSVAMNFYTISRATRDIDIVVNMKEKDIDNFTAGCTNFYFNRNTIVEEIRSKGMFNIIDTISGYKVDMILFKDTEYSRQAFMRRILYTELGYEVTVCSPEDLIIAKLQWIQQLYSDRQANDIQLLLKVPDLDKAYIGKWCLVLKLNTFNFI